MNRDEYYAALYANRAYVESHKDELSHHGILGQKWGVRRFQNPDGSYTEAGLKRYGRALNKESLKGGYRREQDLPAKTLPKGLKVYRTSLGDGDVSNAKAVYITTNETDAKRVRGIVDWMAEKSGKPITDYSEKEYTLTEDLKVPSMKEMREVQSELFADKKFRSQFFKEYAASFQTPEVQDLLRHGEKSKYYNLLAKDIPDASKELIKQVAQLRQTKLKDLEQQFKIDVDKTEERFLKPLANKKLTDLDDMTSEMIATKTVLDFGVGTSETYKNALIDKLSERGYNAMYDNGMMRSGSNQQIPKLVVKNRAGDMTIDEVASQEAYEPIIVFNGSSMKKTSTKPVQMDNDMVARARAYGIGPMRSKSAKDMQRWEKVNNDPVKYEKQKRKDDRKDAITNAALTTASVALNTVYWGLLVGPVALLAVL